MDVLITGAHGTVGTALTEHRSDDYELTLLDRRTPPDSHPHADADHSTVTVDVTDPDALASAVAGHDAVVHLAGDPAVSASFDDVLHNNVAGTRHALEAARATGVETFVFASSNHVVGAYETERAPELYEGDSLVVDHESPIRPDSDYGSSKAAGEAWCRQYAENHGLACYALRIGSIRAPPYDHPYGDAERGVEAGTWSRGSEAYDEQVRRLKCTWQSRRDFAHMVDRCLRDTDVSYDVFYGVSDNENRWFDIDRARERIGYDPRDDGSEWAAPPDG
ncbi:NAD-dependent epimerase/dehydratase family protein [Haloferacaceae archaeon DSL9]